MLLGMLDNRAFPVLFRLLNRAGFFPLFNFLNKKGGQIMRVFEKVDRLCAVIERIGASGGTISGASLFMAAALK